MEQPLWTPPGPIDEILKFAAQMYIRNVVHATGAVFDKASPQLKTEGRQAVDALVVYDGQGDAVALYADQVASDAFGTVTPATFRELAQDFDAAAASFGYDALNALRVRCTDKDAKKKIIDGLLFERQKHEEGIAF